MCVCSLCPLVVQLIHSRVYAQALTLAAMFAAGTVHLVESGEGQRERAPEFAYVPSATKH